MKPWFHTQQERKELRQHGRKEKEDREREGKRELDGNKRLGGGLITRIYESTQMKKMGNY